MVLSNHSYLIIIIIISWKKHKTIIIINNNNNNRLCGHRDETSNHISERCALAEEEYKTRYDWVGKVIHWELCKKLESDHMNKWYIHNPESLQDNKMHKVLWDFQIQTDHLISARRPDLIVVNKKENFPNCELCCSGWPQSKIEKKEDKNLHFARELKKQQLWKMKVTVILVVIGGLGNKKTGRDHTNYGIIKIGQTSAKSPGYLRKNAVTLTPVKNHWLTLVWKTKEREKKDKYLDLARELKKLWNMQVTIIPIVTGAFSTVTKGLSYLPTSPLGQDTTQGQFLSGV